MDENLDKLFWTDIARLTINRNIFMTLYSLLAKIYISDKKKKFVVYKLKLNSQKLGWVYRTVVSTAIKYGVPRVYVSECLASKETYNFYKTHPQYCAPSELINHQRKLNLVYSNLILATFQMVKEKQGRREKIYTIIENMGNA